MDSRQMIETVVRQLGDVKVACRPEDAKDLEGWAKSQGWQCAWDADSERMRIWR